MAKINDNDAYPVQEDALGDDQILAVRPGEDPASDALVRLPAELVARLVQAVITSVTGAVNEDGEITDNDPIINGIALPFSLVTVYTNGVVDGTTLANAAGEFSYRVSPKLSGTYNWRATCVPGSATIQRIINAGAEPLRDSTGAFVTIDINPDLVLYWWNGAVYPSEEALMSAIGGVANGDAWDIGPYRDPALPNLIAPGTFDSTVEGWTTTVGTVEVIGGELAYRPTVGANLGACHIVYTDPTGVTDGKCYELTATIRRGTTTNSLLIGLSSQGNNAAGNISLTVSSTSPTEVSIIGGASTIEANNRAFFRNTGSSATEDPVLTGQGGSCLIDNVSLRQVVPFPGWQTDGWGAVIQFISPPSFGSTKVLVQGDDNSIRGRTRLMYNTDGTLRLIVTANALEQVNLNLGAYPVDTPGEVAFSVGQTEFYVSLNGGEPVTQQAGGTMNGAAVLRFGRSSSGETWDGAISRKAIFMSQQPSQWLQHVTSMQLLNRIATNGDSYMDGAGGVVLNDMLRANSGRVVVNIAQGGNTMSAIKARLLEFPYLREYTWVIWDGSANSYGTVSSYVSLMTDMRDFIAHERIIFIPPISVGPSTSSTPSAYAEDMVEIYNEGRNIFGPTKTFDPCAKIGYNEAVETGVLTALSNGSPEDIQDTNAHVACRSLLLTANPGEVHLGSVAMSAIDVKIRAMLTELGI